MDDTDSTIRATLRAVLAFRKIAGTDFADQIGMKRATWYSRMAGETGWSATEVATVAAALGVPIETLYRGLQVAS